MSILDQLKKAEAEVTSRKLTIGIVQLAKNNETLYGQTQLNEYLKFENELVEQPSMEEIDDVLTELENKLDRLAATRPGMQTTGDIIDSFTVSCVNMLLKLVLFLAPKCKNKEKSGRSSRAFQAKQQN